MKQQTDTHTNSASDWEVQRRPLWLTMVVGILAGVVLGSFVTLFVPRILPASIQLFVATTVTNATDGWNAGAMLMNATNPNGWAAIVSDRQFAQDNRGAISSITACVEAAAKAGKKLVLSGYHDSTGDPAKNAELAKQRAFAVRDALVAEGVAESSIDLKKPEIMPDSKGNDPEARRVDVKID